MALQRVDAKQHAKYLFFTGTPMIPLCGISNLLFVMYDQI